MIIRTYRDASSRLFLFSVILFGAGGCNSLQQSNTAAQLTPLAQPAEVTHLNQAAPQNDSVEEQRMPSKSVAFTATTASEEHAPQELHGAELESVHITLEDSNAALQQLIPPSLEQELINTTHNLLPEVEEPQVLTFWQRFDSAKQIPEVHNRRIEAEKKWYLDHPDYLHRVLARAEPLLPYILNQLEQRNLPSELALLPVVESAYQVFAYSPGRASGLWQIIPSTGRHLGLKQNWWYDGRRDILAATDAALDYLETQSKRFNGDWELALAAYNAGPGRISGAIRYNRKRNLDTDFWHLTRIRKETKDYVPKLHALVQIFSNPELYRIDLPEVSNEFALEHVDIGQQLDLALAAELTGLTVAQIYELNPAYNRWATDPDGPHRLLLPKSVSQEFRQNLAKLPASDRVKWLRHKIKSGQTLSHIAQQHRTTVKIIKQANNLRGTQIRAGKYLLVPTSSRKPGSYSLSKNQRTQKTQGIVRGAKKYEHIVESGESLWLIGKRHNISSAKLAKWNAMAPGDTLSIGQKLVIWKSATVEPETLPAALLEDSPHRRQTIRYTVRKGDSLYLIAKRFNVSVTELKKWNKTGKYLQPGQKLKLYVDISRQSG